MSLGRILGLIFGLIAWNYNFGLIAGEQDMLRPRLTVWVHGTTIRAIVPIKIAGFHFESKLMALEELRSGSYAYQRVLALNQSDSMMFPLNSFYLFRWNGMLNQHERLAAAQKLYQDLSEKIKQLKQQTGLDPIVTIIAHSHGGNIVLNLAALNSKNQSKIVIHNLILLACPVQDSTADWINHETFEKAYIFYSSADWIQRLALQNGRRLADRKFDKIANTNDKLVHVKTSWKNYRLWHNDFKGLAFVAKLPGSLKMIDQQVFRNSRPVQRDYLLTI